MNNELKVHFAGADNPPVAYSITKGADVKYILYSVFQFISGSLGIGSSNKAKVAVYKELDFYNIKHSIIDSGLFTLMFGAHAGKRSEKDIEIWYDAYIKFMLENKVSSSCVEVDCQKILGVDKAWELRERMKKDLPDNQIINVFHKEDKQKGLDRMIEFSDYIAISVPELRFMGQKRYVESIAHYIKNKKPDIKIHLLGCTEIKLLERLKWCSTSDSTSWMSINRYGMIGGNFHERDLKIDKLNYDEHLKVLDQRYNCLRTQKSSKHYINFMFSARYHKNLYAYHLGNQD